MPQHLSSPLRKKHHAKFRFLYSLFFIRIKLNLGLTAIHCLYYTLNFICFYNNCRSKKLKFLRYTSVVA